MKSRIIKNVSNGGNNTFDVNVSLTEPKKGEYEVRCDGIRAIRTSNFKNANDTFESNQTLSDVMRLGAKNVFLDE
jgi:hypothetical protein